MADLKNKTVKDLLELYSDILVELKFRDIVRTENSPQGDIAEFLFSRAFNWNLENSSKAGYDAVDEKGIRYQIKSRRLAGKSSGKRQLSSFRGLDKKKFDYLAAILFNSDFSIYKAVIIPYETVFEKHSSYSEHTNAYKFHLRDNIFELHETKDVTDDICNVFNTL